MSRKLGYGFLAILPGFLLVLAALVALAQAHAPDMSVSGPAMLMYVHVGTQFIVLLIYGYLLFNNRALSSKGRVAWALYMLFLAPAAVISYWLVHVWRAEGPEERRIDVVRLEPHESPS